MQISLKSRKAINFDLNDNLLKQYYPSKNYKNGWRDIKRFFEKSNFVHRQYSGYVSKECVTMTDVLNLVTEMSKQLDWLKKCVKEFDVTIIGDNYSLLLNIFNIHNNI